MPSYLLVGDDVLGRFFAISGGTFRGKAGNVFYCARLSATEICRSTK